MYKKFFKRLLDIVTSFLVITVLSPVFLLVSILILFKLGRPIFFIQARPGLRGKVFFIYKFRTMKNSLDTRGSELTDSLRLTGFGKFLRKTSIDELPEMINILKGDMSLVGPRPLLPEYISLYTVEQSKRHNIRPGLTGLAQVSGRNLLSWEDKFKYDVNYVENVSFSLDFRIILLTFIKVFSREGISSNDSETMTKFKGHKGSVSNEE